MGGMGWNGVVRRGCGCGVCVFESAGLCVWVCRMGWAGGGEGGGWLAGAAAY